MTVMAAIQTRIDVQSFAEVLFLVVLREMLHVAVHFRADNATELDVGEVFTGQVIDIGRQETYSSRT